MTCSAISPGPRAGHGSVFDSRNGLIWIYGGYRTYFPYLSTDGAGSGQWRLYGFLLSTSPYYSRPGRHP